MTVDLQSTPLPLRTNSPKLAMVGGFEPPTSWLTANCSTAELHHHLPGTSPARASTSVCFSAHRALAAIRLQGMHNPGFQRD